MEPGKPQLLRNYHPHVSAKLEEDGICPSTHRGATKADYLWIPILGLPHVPGLVNEQFANLNMAQSK